MWSQCDLLLLFLISLLRALISDFKIADPVFFHFLYLEFLFLMSLFISVVIQGWDMRFFNTLVGMFSLVMSVYDFKKNVQFLKKYKVEEAKFNILSSRLDSATGPKS